MTCSAHIREASCRKGPQLDNVEKVGDSGVLSSERDAYIKTLASSLRTLFGRGGEKILRTGSDE